VQLPHDVVDASGQRLRVVGLRRELAVPVDAHGEPVDAVRPLAAEQHVTVEDVAADDRGQIRRVGGEVGQLDRRPDRGDPAVRVEVERELRLEHRVDPALERDRRPGLEHAALGQDAEERAARAQLMHRRGAAESRLPADQPHAYPTS